MTGKHPYHATQLIFDNLNYHNEYRKFTALPFADVYVKLLIELHKMLEFNASGRGVVQVYRYQIVMAG